METTVESVCADDKTTRQILQTLQERIGPQKFNAWFRHGARLSVTDGQVKVAVPNTFVAHWVETHYQPVIAAAVRQETGWECPVVVTIDPSLTGELRRRQLDSQAQIVSRAKEGLARSETPAEPPALRYSLKDFVVGASNRLAYSAALAVTGGQKAPFNPLFIHGACGVGKTHLLQGICNSVSVLRRGGRAFQWRYVTGEQFTNDFIQALRGRKFEEFRARYRKLDLLAIDDVHFLAAKKATQDEFLHTFNAIDAASRQIVMASDAPPKLVGELNEQLVSRFAAGMVVKIEPPDHATRMEILRRKARGMKLDVGDETLEYIAMHLRGSVRELEGALIKLGALAATEGQRVTPALAREALAEYLARTDSALTLGDIEAVAAAFFGITPADIHSSRRTRTVSVARMVAMFLARRHTQMSYPEIGRYMGKNHSSAVLAVQRMESLLSKTGKLTWMTPLGKRSTPAEEVLKMLAEQFA
jgi:chromosomal replication initiator protein